jgi:ankyrin repeat protein
VTEARRLIQHGANVNANDETVRSADIISTSEGHLDLLRLTLRHDAKIGDKDSWSGTGLVRAAERGHVGYVRRVVSTNIDVNHVNRLGWTRPARGGASWRLRT